MPKGRARKLTPRFIGPYRIVRALPMISSYELEISEELTARRIHPVFHVSKLRPHVKNDDELFPHRDPKLFYDFGEPDDTEWLVDEILAHRWVGKKVQFQVKWNLGDTTWEPLSHCSELAALDDYMTLLGVIKWQDLPRKPSRK
jgi:hypothetical protein